MKNLSELKKEIENELKKSVTIEEASDCVNLRYVAAIGNIVVAEIYKSFDKDFKEIRVIRYTDNEIY